jgi:hypothetical protein
MSKFQLISTLNRRWFNHFGLLVGPFVLLICEGVYVYKEILGFVFYKLKDSSTNR